MLGWCYNLTSSSVLIMVDYLLEEKNTMPKNTICLLWNNIVIFIVSSYTNSAIVTVYRK